MTTEIKSTTDRAGSPTTAPLRRLYRQTARALALAVEKRDLHTAEHHRKVAALAGRLARQMGLGGEGVITCALAGLVHDIGKLGIPQAILYKPRMLSRIERSLVEEHVQTGAEILRAVDFPWPIADTVHQHHERLDGSGYPQALRGDAILLSARVLAVADVFHACSSQRPYRPPLPLAMVLDMLGDDAKFDQRVTAALLTVLDRHGLEALV